MNTKGGVGKSTLAMALAETLSTQNDLRILLIDSDAQMSLSLMLMPVSELQSRRSGHRTLVDLLRKLSLERITADWKDYVASDISDVEESRSLWMIPSDMHLALLEREVSASHRHSEMRQSVRDILREARAHFDLILIDCPPGLSVLTETWLREADYHLTPVKPDFLAVSGLETLRSFKKLNPELGFAENIGVVVNLKDERSPMDEVVHKALLEQADLRCFTAAVPRLSHMQHAALYTAGQRSFMAKYPGVAGRMLREIAAELMQRIARIELQARAGAA